MIGDNEVDLSHSVLNRWTNRFCQLLNAYGGNDVRDLSHWCLNLLSSYFFIAQHSHHNKNVGKS